MKFDWDIARRVLQVIEDSPRSRGDFDFAALALEDEVLHYHLGLLDQGGLIETSSSHALEKKYPVHRVVSMTLAGHDLLDVMRNDTMWGNIKSTLKEKGLGMTLDAIKAAGVWLIHRTFS
ncbi:DUF2513 domain-containing protein [Burkholderia gladioli]